MNEEWVQHWAAMPNSVRALYAEISPPLLPFCRRWWLIEAWGQLCFDNSAFNAVAYNMHNRLPYRGRGWKFHRWRCEMDGPLIGNAKLAGDAPKDFDISEYVHNHK